MFSQSFRSLATWFSNIENLWKLHIFLLNICYPHMFPSFRLAHVSPLLGSPPSWPPGPCVQRALAWADRLSNVEETIRIPIYPCYQFDLYKEFYPFYQVYLFSPHYSFHIYLYYIILLLIIIILKLSPMQKVLQLIWGLWQWILGFFPTSIS